MAWQDYVISIAQIGFIIALIPTLRSGDKPPKATSFMNTVLLVVISFSLFTLGLYFSAATAFAIALTWAVIGLQKLKTDKASKKAGK